MAINEEWEYTRTLAGLDYTVFAVNLQTGETKARAAFHLQTEAENFATNCFVGFGWGLAVERNDDGFVTWTSF